jgi:hypothetical protein
MFGMVPVTTSSSMSLAWMISKRRSQPIGRPSDAMAKGEEAVGHMEKNAEGKMAITRVELAFVDVMRRAQRPSVCRAAALALGAGLKGRERPDKTDPGGA